MTFSLWDLEVNAFLMDSTLSLTPPQLKAILVPDEKSGILFFVYGNGRFKSVNSLVEILI